MKNAKLPLLLLALAALPGAANPVWSGTVALSYRAIESETRQNSTQLKALGYDAAAARDRAREQKALVYPRLSLDGSYRYVSAVPKISVPQVKLSLNQGDNNNYSIGPTLSWTWDEGGTYKNWLAQQANADAKSLQRESALRQTDLAAARSYFQLALNAEQVLEVSDALSLAEKRYHDILVNVRAGSRSRKDELSSHSQVLSRTVQLEQARADFAVSVHELKAVSGAAVPAGTYLPQGVTVPGVAEATGTVYVSLDSLDGLLADFRKYGGSSLWKNHPDIAQYDDLFKSAQFASEAARAGLWPRFALSARSSIDYPNGAVLETVNQNTLSANLSLPLFESGQTRSRASGLRNQSLSAVEQKRAREIDLDKLWHQTRDQLDNLARQYETNETLIREAAELAKITYDSYRAGSATYLEVEDADFRLLEARIQQSRTKVQILMQYAILRSLAE